MSASLSKRVGAIEARLLPEPDGLQVIFRQFGGVVTGLENMDTGETITRMPDEPIGELYDRAGRRFARAGIVRIVEISTHS